MPEEEFFNNIVSTVGKLPREKNLEAQSIKDNISKGKAVSSPLASKNQLNSDLTV